MRKWVIFRSNDDRNIAWKRNYINMKKNLVLGLGFGLGGVIATLSIIQMGLMAHNMKINNNQKK